MPTTTTKAPAKSRAKKSTTTKAGAAKAEAALVDVFRRAGISTDVSGYEAEQVERAKVAPEQLSGDRLRRFIMQGEGASQTSRRRSATVKVNPLEARACEIGFEVAASKGAPLSQKIRPAEVQKVKKALASMRAEKADTVPEILCVSETKLRAFVAGTLPTKDLPVPARSSIKDLTRRVADHQVWARKAAAAALGVHLAEKETTQGKVEKAITPAAA
jgi:hypothetical protein